MDTYLHIAESLCYSPETITTLLTGYIPKVRLVKAMVFPVVIYGYESRAVKKAKELMILNCGVREDS